MGSLVTTKRLKDHNHLFVASARDEVRVTYRFGNQDVGMLSRTYLNQNEKIISKLRQLAPLPHHFKVLFYCITFCLLTSRQPMQCKMGMFRAPLNGGFLVM